MRKLIVVGFALATTAAPVRAQEGVAERLAGRVSPDIAALVLQLGSAAAARGLPVDPLIQKAIEGGAKGVPADRVAIAVRIVIEQLDTAAAALRQAGGTADTTTIAAGGFAITAGLSGRDVAELARAGKDASGDVTVALRVAGTLAALGVPPAETVTLVSASLRAGQPPSDLLSLPSRVQAQIARGVTPAQAAAGLVRAAAAQGRRGPPPDRGPPARPDRPRP